MNISVIIPVYNREKIVLRTLESVISQTHQGIELIIVDNNSTDGTYTTVIDFAKKNRRSDISIKILKEAKQCASAARNTGFKESTCDWIYFLDSDDTIEPAFLEEFAKVIESKGNETDLIICRGDATSIDGKISNKHFIKKNLVANQILHSFLYPTVHIISRGFQEKAGMWNDNLPGWNDWERGVNILLANPRIEWIDKNLAHNFLQEESITGLDYSSKLHIWFKAIRAVSQNLQIAAPKELNYYMLLLEYKKIALAGLCTREKHKSGEDIHETIIMRWYDDIFLRIFFDVLYRYVALGFKGGSHFAKHILHYFSKKDIDFKQKNC